jgi:hypothetical protein
MSTLTANGSKPAADGSKWRRQVSVAGGKIRQAAATYSVAAAAQEIGCPERTLREWIRLGKIEAAPPRPGDRGARISAEVLEELRSTRAAAGGSFQQTAAGGGQWQRQSAADDESVPLIPPRHEAECACCKVWERQVGTLEEQLEHRAEELRRRDQAEAELRRLLLVAQQSLQTAIERAALPPATPIVPRKVRWWWPFVRR